MPLIEAVQWRDAAPDEFAQRFPEVSLRLGSQLTVMENQWAVFFRDGKALDVFGPGRHTIRSYNVPILIDLVQNLGIVGDIFECEVIFVNKSQIRSNFGGRAYSAPSGQIQYQAEIGFYGYLILKVTDPKLFVTEFFGNREASDSEDISRYIRGFALERVIDAFGGYDIVNLVRNLDETTDSISDVINVDAGKIGLQVVDSLFEGIDIPEEARRFASAMGQGAMTMQYAKETAEVLPDGGGGAAGAGLGAGIGFSFGQQMMNQSTQTPKAVVACPNCGAQNPQGQKFCGNCGTNMQASRTIKCPNCGADVPKNNKFCGQCGTSINIKTHCPKCGTENPPGNKFCNECGTKL
jgi:membrane protease subunit (stomatin/prohibitin family)